MSSEVQEYGGVTCTPLDGRPAPGGVPATPPGTSTLVPHVRLRKGLQLIVSSGRPIERAQREPGLPASRGDDPKHIPSGLLLPNDTAQLPGGLD